LAEADEAGERPAGPLECLGRFLAERVDAAMDVGADRGLVFAHGVHDGGRHLGGGRIVEIGERPAADLLAEDRELGPDRLDRIRCRLGAVPFGKDAGLVHSRSGLRPMWGATASRTAAARPVRRSSAGSSMHEATRALAMPSTIRARASSGSIPRWLA